MPIWINPSELIICPPFVCPYWQALLYWNGDIATRITACFNNLQQPMRPLAFLKIFLHQQRHQSVGYLYWLERLSYHVQGVFIIVRLYYEFMIMIVGMRILGKQFCVIILRKTLKTWNRSHPIQIPISFYLITSCWILLFFLFANAHIIRESKATL